jgi:undecaprenyl-phosphate 4-deoxy-4-formamido-L-arabinose transferase
MLLSDLNPLIIDPTDLEELTSVTMFFRGFQLLATGILGEYVGRIYLKLDQEPQFIIRELVDVPKNRDEAGREGHGR